MSTGQHRAGLVTARKAAGLTQEDLAAALHVERSTVVRWEAGRHAPQAYLWPKLATVLGISRGELGALLTEIDQSKADSRGHPTSEVTSAPPTFKALETAKAEHERRRLEAERDGYLRQIANWREQSEGSHAGGEPLSADNTVSAPSLVVPRSELALVEPRTIPSMADMALPAGVELAEGFATPLDYLTFLSSAARVVPGEQGDRIYDQLTNFLRQWAGTMNRRELFQLFGRAATAIAASPAMSGLNDGEQERLAGAIVMPSRVDMRVIDHLATILRDCKQQDDVLGPRAVLHTMLTQRQLARHLLTGCPASLRPRLLTVYSGMSSSAGDYFFDLNDVDSARYYYDQARAAAHEARNIELSIYALCSMSYAASSQGKAHAGIDLAAAAQSLATKTDDQLLRVCAAERAGTAYAIDGQHKPCLTEFDRAQEGMRSAKDTPPESPVYYYHEGLLASHQSECLLLLDKPKEAAASASTGLTVFNKSYVDGYALCTLHLGNAHLQAGEIDEAAEVIGSAAGLAAQNRQARLVKELRTTRARMKPWQGTQVMKELDERLVGMELGA
jgi:transcriptional regulator with XRE-family HTH domain